MKSILFTGLTIALLTSCHKEEITINKGSFDHSVDLIFGIWELDSVRTIDYLLDNSVPLPPCESTAEVVGDVTVLPVSESKMSIVYDNEYGGETLMSMSSGKVGQNYTVHGFLECEDSTKQFTYSTDPDNATKYYNLILNGSGGHFMPDVSENKMSFSRKMMEPTVGDTSYYSMVYFYYHKL